MGNLVVGNYDLVDKPESASAFIYDIRTETMTQLTLGPLTTAYGIWQNEGDASEHYTIVGGYKGDSEINIGFVLDYDAKSKKISNKTTYNYNNTPGVNTHFEGITAVKGGYNLAATGASFASIAREADGSFGKAEWLPVSYPDSKETTGNTVIDNNIMGIFISDSGVQSYIATLSLD
ncbi:MAG TPA: hypothetical protein DDW73_11910 [Rhizobium sp.]|nr:hypothetical protein [Rhizobium sp.]